MPDWATILLSITLSTAISILATYMLQERLWRRRLASVLGSLRTYRDLKRAVDKLGRRPRRRYIVFELMAERSIPQDRVEEAIKGVVREYLGLAGLTGSGVSLVYYEEARGRGVLRVSGEYRYQVLGLLGLLRRIDGARVIVIPLAVTGSIKRAKRLLG